jgi:hypothetical protein
MSDNKINLELDLDDLLDFSKEDRQDFAKKQIKYFLQNDENFLKNLAKAVFADEIKNIMQDETFQNQIKSEITHMLSNLKTINKYDESKFDYDYSLKSALSDSLRSNFHYFKDSINKQINEMITEKDSKLFQDIIKYDLSELILQTLLDKHSDN